VPRLIKKYGNRRMYDVKTSRPITLFQLADLIQQGEEFQVIDHRTGQDLTSLTLVRVLLGQEKGDKRFFSTLLRKLIKKRDSSLVGLSQMNQPGSLSTERVRKSIGQLIEEKKISQAEGNKLLESLPVNSYQNKRVLEKEIEGILRKKVEEVESNYRREILELRRSLENLQENLARITGQNPSEKNRFSVKYERGGHNNVQSGKKRRKKGNRS